MQKILTWLTLGLLAWIPASYAAWMETQGEARIINGDIASAREQAINQAVHYAALKSGVNFTNQQQIRNGRLTINNFSLEHTSMANSIELISESQHNNNLTVILRVDINADPNLQCERVPTRAAILVPQATIDDRTQLRYGQLQDFEKDISAQLSRVIEQQTDGLITLDYSHERLDFIDELDDNRNNRMPSWLGQTTNSQYVMVPKINDISVLPPASSLFGFMEDAPVRQFQMTLSLYHAISGEKIWSKMFHTQAPWEFNKHQQVPTNNHEFWQSKYGQGITHLINRTGTEIESLLSCRPLMAQIIARQDNRIMINIGRQNGVSVGDEFQIILQQNLPDKLNHYRTLAVKNSATITIDQITETSASALLENLEQSDNIQLNDIALKL